LIAGQNAPLVIHAQVDPGALFLEGDGIEELDFESLGDSEPADWGRLIFANGQAGVGIGLRRGFGGLLRLRFGGRGGGGRWSRRIRGSRGRRIGRGERGHVEEQENEGQKG